MNSTTESVRGRRVLVLGLGAFGGGAGCARALVRLGADVTVTDLRPAAELQESVAALEGLPVRLALGGHSEDLVRWAQIVVVNPAVPADSPWLAAARRHGCTLTNEVNLALARACAAPALAITGTHGKSTCAALSAHLLRHPPGRRAVLAGNLGGSVLETVLDLAPGDVLVLELSSFQTERLELPAGAAWPAAAALTTLSADHLDRHGTLEAYHGAKRRLFALQGPDQAAILPAGLLADREWRGAVRGRVLAFACGPLPAGLEGYGIEDGTVVERRGGAAQPLFPLSACPVREPFRWPSLLAAVAGARSLGATPAALADRMPSFVDLPHRMERLPSPPGMSYIDNGVATHPEPTVAALRHLGPGVVLLAGGKDKNLPLEELAEASRVCRSLHLFGSGGRRLAELCAARGIPSAWHRASREAMAAALRALRPGDTLLFSPSFSSYDEYRNFRDRALVFRESCRAELAAAARSASDSPACAY